MNKKDIAVYFSCQPYEAWFSEGIELGGLGTLVMTRKTAGGAIAGASFLCDSQCLGVKDCFIFLEAEASYRAIISKISSKEELSLVEPGELKQFVTGLVRWSRELGLEPHPDYKLASQIFAGIPPADITFTYGKDGVPYYINGPYETPARMREIVEKLLAYKEKTGKEAYFTLLEGPGVHLPAELLDLDPSRNKLK